MKSKPSEREDSIRQKLLVEAFPYKAPSDLEDLKPASNQKHWFWGNWILLSLASACCFTCANLIIGQLSSLGWNSVFYYNSGALALAIGYFFVTSKNGYDKNRVLIWSNGSLDLSLILCYILGAILNTGIFFAINTTFYFCGRSGLNIGIAETVWGFTPFFAGVLEFLFYKTRLQTHHIVGIICMLCAASLISLSQLFRQQHSDSAVQYTVPIIVPVMVSFSMPVVCSSFSMFTKYSCGIKGITAYDYTFGYCIVAKGFFFIASLIHFTYEPFYVKLYLIGCLGSIIDILGAFFCNCAIATGAPAGPILALCDS